jgi:hypothetical protein
LPYGHARFKADYSAPAIHEVVLSLKRHLAKLLAKKVRRVKLSSRNLSGKGKAYER